jgi:hypothetical protein
MVIFRLLQVGGLDCSDKKSKGLSHNLKLNCINASRWLVRPNLYNAPAKVFSFK